MIKDYRYLYNMEQVNFYIANKIYPIETGINSKTGNTYYKFKDSEELQKVFCKWMTRKYN